MDVSYINPFLTSARAVIDQMVKVPMTICKPYRRERADMQAIISALITLTGAVGGLVAINFSQSVALALASGLSGSTLKGIDSDCIDALAEIANMIAGSAKKDFPADGLTAISVPQMVLGANNVQFPKDQPAIVIPCETPRGRFTIEVALQRRTPQAQAA